MKKYFPGLIVIFILMLFSEVKAQQVRSLWIDGVAGLNNNWILNQNAYGNQEMEYATTFGYTAGAGVSYFYNRQWGYNASLLISKMGQNYAGFQAGGEAKRKTKLTYLEVPLLLMRQIPYTNYPTWISFGPDILILLKANQEYSRKGGAELPKPIGMASGDVTDRFKRADIALNISINRMIDVNRYSKTMFLFSINSAIGITDINTPDWQIPNTHGIYGKSHNFYIGIKAGMMFKVARLGGAYW